MQNSPFDQLQVLETGKKSGLFDLYNRLSIVSKISFRIIPWFVLAIALLMFLVVVMRYGFNYGNIALQEINIYFNSILFMLGGAFLFRMDEHIRLDLLYKNFSLKKRACIDLLGTVFFLTPMMIVIFFESFGYVINSWKVLESSHDTGGLGGVYLLKSLLLVMPVFFLPEIINEIIKNLLILTDRVKPIEQDTNNPYPIN